MYLDNVSNSICAQYLHYHSQVLYVDSPGITSVGSVNVDLRIRANNVRSRDVELKFTFGDEVRVKVVDSVTGEESDLGIKLEFTS